MVWGGLGGFGGRGRFGRGLGEDRWCACILVREEGGWGVGTTNVTNDSILVMDRSNVPKRFDK